MFADNLISHSKWSELTFLKSVKVKGYKANIQTKQTFHNLTTNFLKKKLTIICMALSKKLKHFIINLTREVKGMYTEK